MKRKIQGQGQHLSFYNKQERDPESFFHYFFPLLLTSVVLPSYYCCPWESENQSLQVKWNSLRDANELQDAPKPSYLCLQFLVTKCDVLAQIVCFCFVENTDTQELCRWHLSICELREKNLRTVPRYYGGSTCFAVLVPSWWQCALCEKRH